ncbi:Serine/threonine-protein kinase PRP4 homolog (PRP4 kinase) (PRP4 pre-mRNA-processing factor 4 homolog) [Durusdinium trenchii]|uniref:Serine/threonine-protein kinase PRP4 homolog (PRP4 kinase) (PRP4 pre-mRNA-processing factor 4 homolog) n=1 Tax=Durusdinium trenchii TaxID=1381693 RepID=A0ABP0KLD9_9DINO
MLPDRSRSPFGHGPCGPCGGAFPRPAVVVPRPFLRVALQQTQGPVVVPPPLRPLVPPAPPPPEPEKTQEQKDREAHNRLHEAVERNEGFLKAHLGYHIQGSEAGPYTVVSQEALGVGVFSVVWPCADKDNKLVAMKVIRHQDHFRKYANREVEALQRAAALKDQDPESAAHVALLRDSFVHKVSSPQGELEYLCMCFEKLESNLRKVGKQPLEKVLQFGKQIMRALRYLHDVVGIVHCDVKPDNLLLRWDGLAVKLCDFGTARPSPELQAQDELQPLFYRAPEVILGFTRGRKIDVWSAALTIYELIVGRIYLRNCHTPREVLEEIMQLRGPVTKEMLQGRLAAAYVNSKGFHTETRQVVSLESYQKRSLFTELASFADYGKESKKAAEEQAKAQLSRLIGATVVGATKRAGPTAAEKKLKQLAELLDRCLEVDPQQRLTAAEACEMEVFKAVELPPMVDLQEAPPLPEEAPPPLPPDAPP